MPSGLEIDGVVLPTPSVERVFVGAHTFEVSRQSLPWAGSETFLVPNYTRADGSPVQYAVTCVFAADPLEYGLSMQVAHTTGEQFAIVSWEFDPYVTLHMGYPYWPTETVTFTFSVFAYQET